MIKTDNYLKAFIIGILCLLSNSIAFGQSDKSSVILENEAVQNSIDSQIKNNSPGTYQSDSIGLPAVGRPFNPSGVNTPQPSGFNSERPTSIHSLNPSAFNPGSSSGVNPANP